MLPTIIPEKQARDFIKYCTDALIRTCRVLSNELDLTIEAGVTDTRLCASADEYCSGFSARFVHQEAAGMFQEGRLDCEPRPGCLPSPWINPAFLFYLPQDAALELACACLGGDFVPSGRPLSSASEIDCLKMVNAELAAAIGAELSRHRSKGTAEVRLVCARELSISAQALETIEPSDPCLMLTTSLVIGGAAPPGAARSRPVTEPIYSAIALLFSASALHSFFEDRTAAPAKSIPVPAGIAAAGAGTGPGDKASSLLDSIPISITAALGQVQGIKSPAAVKEGALLKLDSRPGDAVKLSAGGIELGRGEIVIQDNCLALRILSLNDAPAAEGGRQ